jgi:hypothetical protein
LRSIGQARRHDRNEIDELVTNYDITQHPPAPIHRASSQVAPRCLLCLANLLRCQRANGIWRVSPCEPRDLAYTSHSLAHIRARATLREPANLWLGVIRYSLVLYTRGFDCLPAGTILVRSR